MVKCSIPRCGQESTEAQKCLLKLCKPHQDRYLKAERRRLSAAKSMSAASAVTFVSTWVQMVDLELFNSIVAPPPEPRPSSPSYPGYAPRKIDPLPEQATRAGQVAIAKREAEQQLLERQLAAETADFNRGQRQVLEVELKVRRATEAKKAKP
mgnify:CR=1 FL=1